MKIKVVDNKLVSRGLCSSTRECNPSVLCLGSGSRSHSYSLLAVALSLIICLTEHHLLDVLLAKATFDLFLHGRTVERRLNPREVTAKRIKHKSQAVKQ